MRRTINLLLVNLTLLLVGCSTLSSPLPIASPAPTLTTAPFLATPYAYSPAAGFCGSFEGEQIMISIEPGIANPRCVQIKADQSLGVVNHTDGPIEVSLGTYQATLAPAQSITFDKPFGEYLARGVHQLGVSPCCGAELVLGIDLNS